MTVIVDLSLWRHWLTFITHIMYVDHVWALYYNYLYLTRLLQIMLSEYCMGSDNIYDDPKYFLYILQH